MNESCFKPERGRLRDIVLLLLALLIAATYWSRSESSGPTPSLVRLSQTWKAPAAGAIGLPSLKSGTVRFATEEAIYEGAPFQLRATVRSAMWLPDSAEAYAFFERDHDRLNYDLLADDNGTVFVGRSERGEVGLYRTTTNRVERTVVRAKTAIPGGSGVFERLRYPDARGENTVFLGYGDNGQKGIYLSRQGKLVRIADRSTIVPGQEKASFQDFSYARIHPSGDVVFTGYSDLGSGIYVSRGETLSRVLDRQTVEPRSGRNYNGALLIGVDADWAYFTSFGATLSIGRVRTDGSSVETLVDENTQVAGQSDKIGSINYASVDNGRILFEGATQGTDFNLYLWEQGNVRALLRKGDLVGEEKIIGIRTGLQALSGNLFVCLIDVEGSPTVPWTRSVFLGDLNGTTSPVGKSIGSAPRSRPPSTAGWLKLGRNPVPVSARELSIPAAGTDPTNTPNAQP